MPDPRPFLIVDVGGVSYVFEPESQVAQANLELTKVDLKLLILLSLLPYVIPSVGVIGGHLRSLFPCGESKSLLGFPSSLTKLIFSEGPTHHTGDP